MHKVVAQGRQLFGTGGGVYTHLGGTVQVQRGGNLLDQLRRGQVVRNDSVCACLGYGAYGVGQPVQLPGIDQCVQRNMHPYPTGMAEGHSLLQFFGGEIARGAPGIESGKPQINSISAAEHSGAKHFAVARGGQNLQRAAHGIS